MAKKMPRRLVALSATAIASVYLAGFMSTHAAAESVSDADIPAAATPNSVSPAVEVTAVPSVVVGASATATPAATATPMTTASANGYADGTYSGTGTSRFGNVTVSVTIAGGAISNVQIIKVTTSFPVSRIASLPAQVLQKQSASVNSVTGATYSSAAFKQGVTQALAQATTDR
jgi:uncharacterized protein with FMN-binding domain